MGANCWCFRNLTFVGFSFSTFILRLHRSFNWWGRAIVCGVWNRSSSALLFPDCITVMTQLSIWVPRKSVNGKVHSIPRGGFRDNALNGIVLIEGEILCKLRRPSKHNRYRYSAIIVSPLSDPRETIPHTHTWKGWKSSSCALQNRFNLPPEYFSVYPLGWAFAKSGSITRSGSEMPHWGGGCRRAASNPFRRKFKLKIQTLRKLKY